MGKVMGADMNSTFGEFLKEMRIKAGMSLRQFCIKYGLDPGNMSRIERGIAAPPQAREKLEEWAHHLGIERESEDWYSFFDRAYAIAGRIPEDVMSDDQLVSKLPLVFRTLRGEKLSAESLEKLAEMIRKA